MRSHGHLLKPYGVSTLQELDSKDFGTYFLSKDITGQHTSPAAAAQSLHDNLRLIEHYREEMNRGREEHRAATARLRESRRNRQRTERLFAVKSKSLVKKPEFQTRVADK